MMPNIIRLAVGVATLALLFSIPAAGQAPKLSTQQLNTPEAESAHKTIAAPKALTAYSSNGNKQIAAPKAPTFAFGKSSERRPPRGDGGNGGLSSLEFLSAIPGLLLRYRRKSKSALMAT